MKRQMNSFFQSISIIPESHAQIRNVDVIKDFDNSFDIFISGRDWSSIAEFWKRLISQINDNTFLSSDGSIPNFLGIKGSSCKYINFNLSKIY